MRACWLKWVGRDWSISADYIWLNYSGANTGARGNDAPAAAHGHVACDHAGNRLVRNIGPVRPGIDGASVHHERLRDVDPALRARRRQRPGTAKRQVAPHLHAAQRDVR
ncbi:Uncharacterised protein [Collinsella aerofaciens]|uniref:Uncharacterized protein n=1 Tax=Collinsella aerofaciens TaxID=74426 RepID=A0A174FU75_9ACTN|nr:Uncharacterised protein [Collinsella aerofaciens]